MPGKGIFRGKVKRLALMLFIYKAGHSTAYLAFFAHLFAIAYVTRRNTCLTLYRIMTDTVSCEVNASSDANTDTSIGPNQSEIGRGVSAFNGFIHAPLWVNSGYFQVKGSGACACDDKPLDTRKGCLEVTAVRYPCPLVR